MQKSLINPSRSTASFECLPQALRMAGFLLLTFYFSTAIAAPIVGLSALAAQPAITHGGLQKRIDQIRKQMGDDARFGG